MNYKVAYAFLESHFSKSRNDIIDIYSDMLLLFSGNNSNNTKKILEKIDQETGIKIPYEVGKALLKRLRKKGYVEYSDFEKYILTERGETIKIENTKNYDNDGFNDIEKELKSLKIANSLKEIIEYFLKSNITKVDFNVDDGMNVQSNEDVLNKFFKYLSDEKKKNIDKYNKIIGLLYTGFLSKLLIQREIEGISADLDGLDVYLDTNILISLLGYHENSINVMTEDVIEKLKSMNANLYISSLTLNELNNVLNNYQPEKYLSDYPVDSIYYTMKLKKLSKFDVNVVIENIENILLKKGININYNISKSSLEEDQSFQDKIMSLTSYKKKGTISEKIIEHDVLMYLFVKKQRQTLHSTYAKSIDKSKIIFLTLDHGFSSWNLLFNKEKTIPEIIYIESVAIYLWLKNPNVVNIFEIWQFLNRSFNKQIISENLWESFLLQLNNKIENEEITQEECSLLLSMESTKTSLLELEKDIEKNKEINFSKILSEESFQKVQGYKNSTSRKIEGLYLANKTSKKKQEEAENTILIVKENIQRNAEKEAKILEYTVKILILIVISLFCRYFVKLDLFDRLGEYSWVLSVVIPVGSALGLWIAFQNFINKFFENLYNKTVNRLVNKKTQKIFNKKNKK